MVFVEPNKVNGFLLLNKVAILYVMPAGGSVNNDFPWQVKIFQQGVRLHLICYFWCDH